MASSTLIILILFLLLKFSENAGSGYTKEAYALLKWKTSLQNQNYSLLSSWRLYPVDATNVSSYSEIKKIPCAWFGIDCNPAKRVISINLSTLGLKGTLHEFSFSFSSFPQGLFPPCPQMF